MTLLSDDNTYIPSIVFFETTTACDYACRHCRAEAREEPSPDQLSTEEALDILDQVRKLHDPAPELIFTGGNTLLRKDLPELVEYSDAIGLPFSLSPSGSELLNGEMLDFLKEHNARSISLSIDGVSGGTHDWLRKREGSFDLTLGLLRKAREHGLKVQVNTTVMKRNINELPEIAAITKNSGASAWEVFFLIKTGRGMNIDEVSPQEYMQINNWLADLSSYGLHVRTVEGPVLRVMKAMRRISPEILYGTLYSELSEKSEELLGMHTVRTPDSAHMRGGNGSHRFRGTLFIGNNGDVSPSGLFNAKIGNTRTSNLMELLSGNRELLDTRNSGKLRGKCGRCNFMHICGGSRARALNTTGDPFAQDPSCLYPADLSLKEAI